MYLLPKVSIQITIVTLIKTNKWKAISLFGIVLVCLNIHYIINKCENNEGVIVINAFQPINNRYIMTVMTISCCVEVSSSGDNLYCNQRKLTDVIREGGGGTVR